MNTPQREQKAEPLLNLAIKLAHKAAALANTNNVRIVGRDPDGNVVSFFIFARGEAAAELYAASNDEDAVPDAEGPEFTDAGEYSLEDELGDVVVDDGDARDNEDDDGGA